MKNLELITSENIGLIDKIGSELAETYKVAFAGPPWFERSRCEDISCSVDLQPFEPGEQCVLCCSTLSPAYKTDTLLTNWQRIICEEFGIMEVALDENYPVRATIARPTNPEELFQRKYSQITEMRGWLARVLPSEFLWIEDTFADRERKPKGNLSGRGATLERLEKISGGLSIATRTLAEPIVAATLRDAATKTVVYIGTERVGEYVVSKRFSNPGYSLPQVPDKRTMLVIKNKKGMV